MFQLTDSAFPAGGFAHSGGLEAVAQHGWIGDAVALEDLLRAQLNQAALGMAPFVVGGHRQPDRLAEHDQTCEAFLSNHVANRASRATGRAFLLAASRIFPEPGVLKISGELRGNSINGHFAPLFGATCGELGIELESAVRVYLFLTLRGLVSSAVRLGIAGPMEAQSIQWRLAPFAENLVVPASQTAIEDAAQTSPLLDLMQGTHDRLYSRLFQS